MPALEPGPDADDRSDNEVILAIRGGDTAAADELYRRHHRAGMAFAESLAGRTLAPDLVSDAFVRILDVLQRGGGPTQVFRSYLYTTIRNLYVDHVRHHSRQTSLPDFGPLEADLAIGDGLDEHFEHSLVKKAFCSLPERWQTALWYATVEGVSLEEAGKCLGVAPNAVAALTFRAREGLRQAYLTEHLNATSDQACEEILSVLAKYVRGTLRMRMRTMVEAHLPHCRQCSYALLELREVNSNLRGVLLIALLGAATAGYLAPVLGPPLLVGASGIHPAVGIHRLHHLGRAAAVAAAAAAGIAVLAWAHHHGATPRAVHPPGAPSPSQEPVSPPSPSLPSPSLPSALAPPVSRSHIGMPTASVSYTSALLQPSAGVVLGAPRVVRLTTTTPSWFHVGVPISTAVAPEDLSLTLRASSWSGYHVHREPGFGPWACTQQAGASSPTLECHLPAGASAVDLGFDVQTAKPVRLAITVVAPAGQPVTSAFVVGS